MDSARLEGDYTATCCTLGCAWVQPCLTKYLALLAAHRHAEEHELHLPVVLPASAQALECVLFPWR